MRPSEDHLGQALVNWLWAFYFFIAGMAMTIAKTAPDAPFLNKVARTVLLSVGGAALIVCSRTVWRELRAMHKPPIPLPPGGKQ